MGTLGGTSAPLWGCANDAISLEMLLRAGAEVGEPVVDTVGDAVRDTVNQSVGDEVREMAKQGISTITAKV